MQSQYAAQTQYGAQSQSSASSSAVSQNLTSGAQPQTGYGTPSDGSSSQPSSTSTQPASRTGSTPSGTGPVQTSTASSTPSAPMSFNVSARGTFLASWSTTIPASQQIQIVVSVAANGDMNLANKQAALSLAVRIRRNQMRTQVPRTILKARYQQERQKLPYQEAFQ